MKPISIECSKSGESKFYNFFDGFSKFIEGCVHVAFHPLFVLSPFLFKHGFTRANSSNHKNAESLYSSIENFLKESSDKNSLYQVLINTVGSSPKTAIVDVMGILAAGMDTTSKTMT